MVPCSDTQARCFSYGTTVTVERLVDTGLVEAHHPKKTVASILVDELPHHPIHRPDEAVRLVSTQPRRSNAAHGVDDPRGEVFAHLVGAQQAPQRGVAAPSLDDLEEVARQENVGLCDGWLGRLVAAQVGAHSRDGEREAGEQAVEGGATHEPRSLPNRHRRQSGTEAASSAIPPWEARSGPVRTPSRMPTAESASFQAPSEE